MSKLTVFNLINIAVMCCNLLVSDSYASLVSWPNCGMFKESVDVSPDRFSEITGASNVTKCREACNADDKCLSYSFCGSQGYQQCITSRFSFESEVLLQTLEEVDGQYEIQAELDWNPDKVEVVKLKKEQRCTLYNRDFYDSFEIEQVKRAQWSAMDVYPIVDMFHCAKLSIDNKADSFLIFYIDQPFLSGQVREEFDKIVAKASEHKDAIAKIHKHLGKGNTGKFQKICALHSSGSESKVVFSEELLSRMLTIYGIIKVHRV